MNDAFDKTDSSDPAGEPSASSVDPQTDNPQSEKPANPSGDQSGNAADEQSASSVDPQTGNPPSEKPANPSGDQSRNAPDDQSGNAPDEQSASSVDPQTGNPPSEKPANPSGDQSGNAAGEQSGNAAVEPSTDNLDYDLADEQLSEPTGKQLSEPTDEQLSEQIKETSTDKLSSKTLYLKDYGSGKLRLLGYVFLAAVFLLRMILFIERDIIVEETIAFAASIVLSGCLLFYLSFCVRTPRRLSDLIMLNGLIWLAVGVGPALGMFQDGSIALNDVLFWIIGFALIQGFVICWGLSMIRTFRDSKSIFQWILIALSFAVGCYLGNLWADHIRSVYGKDKYMMIVIAAFWMFEALHGLAFARKSISELAVPAKILLLAIVAVLSPMYMFSFHKDFVPVSALAACYVVPMFVSVYYCWVCAEFFRPKPKSLFLIIAGFMTLVLFNLCLLDFKFGAMSFGLSGAHIVFALCWSASTAELLEFKKKRYKAGLFCMIVAPVFLISLIAQFAGCLTYGESDEWTNLYYNSPLYFGPVLLGGAGAYCYFSRRARRAAKTFLAKLKRCEEAPETGESDDKAQAKSTDSALIAPSAASSTSAVSTSSSVEEDTKASEDVSRRKASAHWRLAGWRKLPLQTIAFICGLLGAFIFWTSVGVAVAKYKAPTRYAEIEAMLQSGFQRTHVPNEQNAAVVWSQLMDELQEKMPDKEFTDSYGDVFNLLIDGFWRLDFELDDFEPGNPKCPTAITPGSALDSFYKTGKSSGIFDRMDAASNLEGCCLWHSHLIEDGHGNKKFSYKRCSEFVPSLFIVVLSARAKIAAINGDWKELIKTLKTQLEASKLIDITIYRYMVETRALPNLEACLGLSASKPTLAELKEIRSILRDHRLRLMSGLQKRINDGVDASFDGGIFQLPNSWRKGIPYSRDNNALYMHPFLDAYNKKRFEVAKRELKAMQFDLDDLQYLPPNIHENRKVFIDFYIIVKEWAVEKNYQLIWQLQAAEIGLELYIFRNINKRWPKSLQELKRLSNLPEELFVMPGTVGNRNFYYNPSINAGEAGVWRWFSIPKTRNDSKDNRLLEVEPDKKSEQLLTGTLWSYSEEHSVGFKVFP